MYSLYSSQFSPMLDTQFRRPNNSVDKNAAQSTTVCSLFFKAYPFSKSQSNPLEITQTKIIQQNTPIFIYYFLQLSYFINWGSFFTLKTYFFGLGAKKTSEGWGPKKPCEHSPTGSQED